MTQDWTGDIPTVVYFVVGLGGVAGALLAILKLKEAVVPDANSQVTKDNNNGKVDVAESADAVAWTGVTGKPSSFAPATHTHPISDITGLDTALAAKAPLASPALTGTPTAPTATAGTSST